MLGNNYKSSSKYYNPYNNTDSIINLEKEELYVITLKPRLFEIPVYSEGCPKKKFNFWEENTVPLVGTSCFQLRYFLGIVN